MKYSELAKRLEPYLSKYNGGGVSTTIRGVFSHSDLLDLDADDHRHYFNAERGDARYSRIGHDVVAEHTAVGATTGQLLSADGLGAVFWADASLAVGPHELSGDKHFGLLNWADINFNGSDLEDIGGSLPWNHISFALSDIRDVKNPELGSGYLFWSAITDSWSTDSTWQGELPTHDIDFFHSGSLPWGRLNFATSDITDVLPPSDVNFFSMFAVNGSKLIEEIRGGLFAVSGQETVLKTDTIGRLFPNYLYTHAVIIDGSLNGLSNPYVDFREADYIYFDSSNFIVGLQLSMIPAGDAAPGKIAVSNGTYWYYAYPEDVFDSGSGMIVHALDSTWHTGTLPWADLNFTSSEITNVKTSTGTSGYLLTAQSDGSLGWTDPSSISVGMSAHDLSGVYHTGLLDWADINFTNSNLKDANIFGLTQVSGIYWHLVRDSATNKIVQRYYLPWFQLDKTSSDVLQLGVSGAGKTGWLVGVDGTGSNLQLWDPGSLGGGGGISTHALNGIYHSGLLNWNQIDFTTSVASQIRTLGAPDGYVLVASNGYINYRDPDTLGGGGSLTSHTLSGAYHSGLLDWDDINFPQSDVRDLYTPGGTSGYLLYVNAGKVGYLDPATVGGGGSGMIAHALDSSWHTGLLPWNDIDFFASDLDDIGGNLEWSKINFSASNATNIRTPTGPAGYVLAVSATGYITYIDPSTVGGGGGGLVAHDLSGSYHYGTLAWSKIDFSTSEITNIRSNGTSGQVLVDGGTYVGRETPTWDLTGTNAAKLVRPNNGEVRFKILRALDRVGDTWQDVSAGGGWTNNGIIDWALGNLRAKKFGDLVFLGGATLNAGAVSSPDYIGTLPTALRPTRNQTVVIAAGSTYAGGLDRSAALDIGTNGDLYIRSNDEIHYISFDGVFYFLD